PSASSSAAESVDTATLSALAPSSPVSQASISLFANSILPSSWNVSAVLTVNVYNALIRFVGRFQIDNALFQNKNDFQPALFVCVRYEPLGWRVGFVLFARVQQQWAFAVFKA